MPSIVKLPYTSLKFGIWCKKEVNCIFRCLCCYESLTCILLIIYPCCVSDNDMALGNKTYNACGKCGSWEMPRRENNGWLSQKFLVAITYFYSTSALWRCCSPSAVEVANPLCGHGMEARKQHRLFSPKACRMSLSSQCWQALSLWFLPGVERKNKVVETSLMTFQGEKSSKKHRLCFFFNTSFKIKFWIVGFTFLIG